MTTTIINAKPFLGGKIHSDSCIMIKDGKIASIGSTMEGDIIDAGGGIVAAGYIDIHTHGGFGKDCMEPTFEAIDTVARYHLSTGITTFCPTTMTAGIADIEAALDNIRRYKSRYARIAGVHLEGPFLSPSAAGAHPLDKLRNPDKDNTQFITRNKDVVSRITIAPDLKGAAFATRLCREEGIQVSIGHDNSIDDEILACVEEGASSVTHMCNCTSRPSRRAPSPKKHLGLTEIGLADSRLMCEIIADGRHVPDMLFDIVYKLKGKDGICLVSDSLSVAGMSAGTYYLGDGESKQEIRVEDGVAILPTHNTYAGSVTPVSKMVARLYALGYPAEEVLAMATLNPARLMGLTDRGDLQTGKLGDVNILNPDLTVRRTIMS